MKRKPAKPDNPAQSERFIKTARELGADESPSTFERVLRRVAAPKAKTSAKPKP